MVKEEALGFGLFVLKKQFEDVTLGSGKLRWQTLNGFSPEIVTILVDDCSCSATH